MKARDIIPGWPRRGSTSKPFCFHSTLASALKGCERCTGETERAIEFAANVLNRELNCLGFMVGGTPIPSWEAYKRNKEWESSLEKIRFRNIDGSLL